MTTILPEAQPTSESTPACPAGVPWCNEHSVARYIEGDEHTHYGKYSLNGVELLINHTGDPEPGDHPYVHIQVDGGADAIQGSLPDLDRAYTALLTVLTGAAIR